MRFGLGRKEPPLTTWVSVLPPCPWIGCRMVLRMKIRPSRCWMPSKRISIGLKRVSVLRLKGGEVLNLKSSVNYDNASVPSRSGKGKAQVL
jgi:hypothetical protein